MIPNREIPQRGLSSPIPDKKRIELRNMKPTKKWHNRAVLEILNNIDKLERELEIQSEYHVIECERCAR